MTREPTRATGLLAALLMVCTLGVSCASATGKLGHTAPIKSSDLRGKRFKLTFLQQYRNLGPAEHGDPLGANTSKDGRVEIWFEVDAKGALDAVYSKTAERATGKLLMESSWRRGSQFMDVRSNRTCKTESIDLEPGRDSIDTLLVDTVGPLSRKDLGSFAIDPANPDSAALVSGDFRYVVSGIDLPLNRRSYTTFFLISGKEVDVHKDAHLEQVSTPVPIHTPVECLPSEIVGSP